MDAVGGELPSKSESCVQFLICPVCGAHLAKVGGTLKCSRAHAFDIAREGYVNLLLAGRKRPKVLGDTKEMLRARRDFLDCGFYSPLSDAINERVYNHLVDVSSLVCVADVGCGEGYYVGRLKHHLDSRLGRDDICYFGLDVSKEAARLAAKRYKDMRFVVASVTQKVLFADHVVRVLLNVFAPRNPVEFDRVIAEDGMLLVVIPGPGHLASLRLELDLLGIEADKRQRVVEQFSSAFRLAGERTIAYEVHLDGDELLNLIQMTPNYWHSSSETWDGVRAMGSVQTEASFTVLEFRR
jgi:SAM-dependent methyltransferase